VAICGVLVRSSLTQHSINYKTSLRQPVTDKQGCVFLMISIQMPRRCTGGIGEVVRPQVLRPKQKRAGTDVVPCGTKDKSPDQLMQTARWNFQLEVIVSTSAGCPPVHHLWPILVKKKFRHRAL
jgi:hypothetical protein